LLNLTGHKNPRSRYAVDFGVKGKVTGAVLTVVILPRNAS
jgi:hypothetical protein